MNSSFKSSDLRETDRDTVESVWAGRHLNPHRLAAIEEFAGESMLDVGCGNGAYVLALKDRLRTFGVDIHRYSAWDEAAEHFDTCDAAQLPLADKSFDTVTSFEVLEHVADPVATLREFRRVARENLILTVPNCDLPDSLTQSRLTFFHYTDSSHVNFFTEETLQTTCESAGLQVREVRRINPCNMSHVVADLLGFRSRLSKNILQRLFKKQFCMSLLAVAEVT